MRDDWKEYNLDEVYEFKSGLSKPRSEFGSGFTFISFKDVFYNYFLPENPIELVNSNLKEQESCSVKRGDVFLTRTSETFDELGMSSVALKDYDKATFNGFSKRLRPIKEGLILPEYAGYYFRSQRFRNYVTSMATMSTRASLNNEILSKLTIIVPPQNEQKIISQILKSLDDKIELNRQMNETLEQMAQALFKSWFVDFDPVIDNALAAGNPIPEALQAKAEKRRTVIARSAATKQSVPNSQQFASAQGLRNDVLPEHLRQLFPASFTFTEALGWIPEGWEVTTIDTLADVVGGGTPSTKMDEYFTESGIPWLSPKDLSGYNWKHISKGATDITELGLQKSSAKLMPKGTVLFSSRAPIGYTAIAENEICTNQGFKSLVPLNPDYTEYFYQFLKGNVANIEAIASGSTFKEVSGTAIKGFSILNPPSTLVNHFSTKVDSFSQKQLNIQKETQTLSTLRDTLLPKLISGELRVGEGEEAINHLI